MPGIGSAQTHQQREMSEVTCIGDAPPLASCLWFVDAKAPSSLLFPPPCFRWFAVLLSVRPVRGRCPHAWAEAGSGESSSLVLAPLFSTVFLCDGHHAGCSCCCIEQQASADTTGAFPVRFSNIIHLSKLVWKLHSTFLDFHRNNLEINK